MKLPFSKRVYFDSLRRTRAVFVLSLLAGVFASLAIAHDTLELGAVSTGGVQVYPQLLLMMLFLLFEETVIHSWHRKRKWDMFRTLPASRAEWFWSTFLAEMTTLVFYILVCEVTVVIAGKREKEQTYFGTKTIFFEHLQRAILLFVIGTVFLSVVIVIREMTHSVTTYVILLVGGIGGYWLIWKLIPEVVRSFSGNFVSVEGSFAFRMRLLYRSLYSGEWNDENAILRVAYDWVALLVNLAFAALFLFLARRISERSRAEYIRAEYRNRFLLRFLTVYLNLIPLLLCAFTLVIGNEYTANIVLIPVLMALIMFFLCRLFHEKPGLELLYGVGVSVLIAGVITGATLLYARLGRALPERADIIAIRLEQSTHDGMVYSPDKLDKLYRELEKRRDDGKAVDSESLYDIKLNVYTKTGCRQYYIDRGQNVLNADGEDGYEADSRRNAFFCGYGKKARIYTEFSTWEEYEEFAALLPEEERIVLPVYYVNALGGLSESKQTVIVGRVDIIYKDTIEIAMQQENYFASGDPFECRFTASSTAVEYYNEKICRPQRQKFLENVKKNPEELYRVVLYRLVDFETRENHEENWYYTRYVTRGYFGENSFQQKKAVSESFTLTDEHMKIIAESLLGPEQPIRAGMDLTEVYLIGMNGRAGEYESEEYVFHFLIPSERLLDLFEEYGTAEKEERERRDREWREREEQQNSEEGQTE